MASPVEDSILPVDGALQVVLSVARRLQPVAVPLHDALGMILAEDIRAAEPLPPYRASVKDGYAVVASDGPGVYPVVAESRAGNDGMGVVVSPGTVAYVTTGGPIPDGADAVVQIENTEQIEDPSNVLKKVKICTRVTQGRDIRPVCKYIAAAACDLSCTWKHQLFSLCALKKKILTCQYLKQ